MQPKNNKVKNRFSVKVFNLTRTYLGPYVTKKYKMTL